MTIEGNAVKTLVGEYFLVTFLLGYTKQKNKVAKTHIEPLIGVTVFVDTLTLKFKGTKGEVNSGNPEGQHSTCYE